MNMGCCVLLLAPAALNDAFACDRLLMLLLAVFSQWIVLFHWNVLARADIGSCTVDEGHGAVTVGGSTRCHLHKAWKR
jgi:hypothetical protein